MPCDATTQAVTHGPHAAGPLRRAMNALSARFSPAQPIANGPKPAGGTNTTPDLTARALRLHNRSKDAADRYLAKHMILDRKD